MVSPRYKSNTLGTGAILIENWLDYICPFSQKQFNTFYKSVYPAVEKKYPGQFTFVFQHVPQPWHGQGAYLHEAAIAVGQIDASKFWEFSNELFEQSQNFYDTKTFEKSRKQIVGEIAEIAEKVGINKQKFLELVSIDVNGSSANGGPKVIDDLKYFIRLGRQNGIHVTPTVTVNGVVDPSISSSWTTEQWIEKLESVLEAKNKQL